MVVAVVIAYLAVRGASAGQQGRQWAAAGPELDPSASYAAISFSLSVTRRRNARK